MPAELSLGDGDALRVERGITALLMAEEDTDILLFALPDSLARA